MFSAASPRGSLDRAQRAQFMRARRADFRRRADTPLRMRFQRDDIDLRQADTARWPNAGIKYMRGLRRPRAMTVIDRTRDRPIDRSADRPGDRPIDRLFDRRTDRPIDRLVDRSVDRPFDRATDRLVDRPFDHLFDRPVDRIAVDMQLSPITFVQRAIGIEVPSTVRAPWAPSWDPPAAIRYDRPWMSRRVMPAVPHDAAGQIGDYAEDVFEPQIELIAQGAMLKNPEPQVFGAIESRKRTLITSRPVLRTLGFARSFKQLMKSNLQMPPSSELPYLYKTRDPAYLPSTVAEVPHFDYLPVFARARYNSLRGRDVATGFLTSNLGRL